MDWKKKLTSRKLWAAICALATNLIIIFGGTEEVAVKVTAVIMAGAAVVAYIIGEGLVDSAAVGLYDEYEELPEEEEEAE